MFKFTKVKPISDTSTSPPVNHSTIPPAKPPRRPFPASTIPLNNELTNFPKAAPKPPPPDPIISALLNHKRFLQIREGAL